MRLPPAMDVTRPTEETHIKNKFEKKMGGGGNK